jgi:hypothetical protein
VKEVDFKRMFDNVSKYAYKIERVKTPYGISKYLNEKELYAAKRERAYQCSRKFQKPKA